MSFAKKKLAHYHKMGNDGGTITNIRRLVVKSKKEKSKTKTTMEEKSQQAYDVWHTCKITGEPLDEPHIVACKMGYLYNKDACIEQIMENKLRQKQDKKLKEPYQHLLGIKEVANVKFEKNPLYDSKIHDTSKTAKYICPITRKELNSSGKFYLLRNCGHVLEEQALQLTDQKLECLVCNTPFERSINFLTLLNPNQEEEKEIRVQVTQHVRQLQEEEKSKKKDKKRKKHDTTAEDESTKHEEEKHSKRIKTNDNSTHNSSAAYQSIFISDEQTNVSSKELFTGRALK